MHVKISENTEKVIYLLRHGQSEDNASPVFQGPDSPLSKQGEQQAQFIAERTKQLDFDVLISSPLERARQTAEAVSSATNHLVEYSDLFVERIKPAKINGKPFTDQEASDLWQVWEESMYTPGLQAEDGENYDDIILRADSALDYLYNRPEKRIVVTSHGYFVRTLMARVLLGDGLNPVTFKHFHRSMHGMENTGLSVLVYEPAFGQEPCWKVWIYNDHAHLAE